MNIKVLLTILVCVSTCFAQTRPSSRKPVKPQVRAPFLQHVQAYDETLYVTKVVLKNGMTVLVNEFRAQPVVSMQLHVRAGTFDEPPQLPATAQLAAAILCRGPAKDPTGTFRQKVHAFGGTFRTSTGYTTTLFEIVAASSHWKRVLNVQAETILNPSFDQERITLEAKLIQGEARGMLGDPRELANEKLLQLAFNQPRMGQYHSISSSAAENYTPESLTAFYKSMYTPSRMMLVVSGDVGSSEVLNEVVRVYTKPAGPGAKSAARPPGGMQDGFRYGSLRGVVAVPNLFFGFRAVPEDHPDYRALSVLSAALGAGDSSIILYRLRDQKKIIYSAETELTPYPGFGYFTIHVKTSPANIDRSEIALLTEIELLKREELTDTEMERALAQAERSYWAGLETVSERAAALGRFEALGDWKRMDRYLAELRKVTAADVKRVAAKYLTLENCSLFEYLPAAGEERRLTSETMRNTLGPLLEPSTDQEQAERDKEIVLGVKVPPAAAGFKFSEIRYPFQTASILRGPDLYIREDHTTPLIEMGLFLPGGRLNENKENSGITALMTRLMLRGGTDIRQFYRQFEVYGARVRPVVEDDYFGFYVSAPGQNFEAAFRLLLETIRAPNFEKEEVERQKELQVAESLSNRTSGEYPQKMMDQVLFQNFAYSLDGYGTESTVVAITPEALKNWYDTYVHNKKPLVAIIGDTKGTSLATVFVQRFSGSRFQETKIPDSYAKPLEKGGSAKLGWKRSESLILFGFQAPPEDDEDGYAVAVLQGYAGGPGRLSQELRDRLGVAHRVSVQYKPRLRGGGLIISAAASPGGEEKLLEALREEIKQARTGPISFRDFRSAVNEALGTYAIQQQLRSVQIGDVAEYVFAGKGINQLQNYPVGLQEVREEDLDAAIQRFLDPDRSVVVQVIGSSN